MKRRGFLKSLTAFAAACTLDPELVIWVPNRKLISVPKPSIPKPSRNTLWKQSELVRAKLLPVWNEPDWTGNRATTAVPPQLYPIASRDYRIPFFHVTR